MELRFTAKDGSGLLTASGGLSVEDAAEFKAWLADYLSKAADLTVDMGAVASADLSTLQILCAAHKAAIKAGKSFGIAGLNGAVKTAARDAGFAEATCPLAAEGCLWKEDGRK